MFKIDVTNKIFLISISSIIIAFLMFYYNLGGITGFVGADVSIKSKTDGNILLSYDYSVNLTTSQNITAEFVNTGSTNYTATIEITVYYYNNTTGNLNELVSYTDASVFLYPGERQRFTTSFLPIRTGFYYIRVRVPYDAKVAEQWGSFYVFWYWSQTPEIIHVITYPGGGTIPAQTELGITGLGLDYKDEVDLYPGQEILLSVGVNNTGTINLHNMKLFSSTTEYIDFEVNPKEIFELRFGEHSIFLISLKVSEDIPEGEYDFFFEVLCLETKRTGNIVLNVTPFAKPSPKDEIYETILNYEYLITELEYEIYLTSSKEFNTSRAEMYLDNAKRNLGIAKECFDEEDYECSRDYLDKVKRDLEKVVFELAAISFRVFAYPAYSPFLILVLLLMIVIGVIIVFYLYKKRKKEKKPRIIREFTEEET
ncbi:MAG: hypothetical protein GTN36_05820 [Candidatus Aenigmarchaeota archaeon]|nr:hypothetical protein [Candidatus Aenigmarchaeota archaeon]